MYCLPFCKLFLRISCFWMIRSSFSIKVLDTTDDISHLQQSKSGVRFKENVERSLNTSTTCFRFLNYRTINHQYLFKLESLSIGVSIAQDNTLYSYGSNLYFWPENGDIVTSLYMMTKDADLGFKIVSFEITEWPMNSWNTFCFRISMTFRRFSLFINGDNVLSKVFDDHVLLVEELKLKSMSLMAKNPGLKNAFPAIGKISDINIWSKELSKKEMDDWSSCQFNSLGDIYSYDVDKLVIEDMQLNTEDKSFICKRNKNQDSNTFIIPMKSLSYQEITHYCSNIGTKMSIAHSNDKASKMLAELEVLNDVCGNRMYSGHKMDTKSSTFVDYSKGEPLKLDKWLEGEPNNFGGKEDCVELRSYDLDENKKKWAMNDIRCDKHKCPSCEIHSHRQLQLRGICRKFSKIIDNQYYVLPASKSERSIQMIGYVSSKIIWNQQTQSWDIVNQLTSDVIARTNDTVAFPLGTNNWHFKDRTCKDEGDTPWRRMNIYFKTATDKFCCTDGTCINWSFKCDNVPHCSDESDEFNCSVVIIPSQYDETKQPLVKGLIMYSNSYTKGMKNDIKVDITILDIFSFDERDSTISLKYKIIREWKDSRLNFRDLNWDETRNKINVQDIWYPRFEMASNVKKVFNKEYHGVYVRRKDNFTWFNGMEELLKSRIFKGDDNSIIMSETQHLELFCVFDQLAMYPFDEESCEIRIKLKEIHPSFVNILPKIIDNGPTTFSQYNIKEWTIKVENKDSVLNIVIELHLKRNIATIFMVVYFPTILMNVINQAMNYLNSRSQYVDFATIIKVNVTCMIVISMVYDSVSKYLISTPEIKKIEIWLISSLIYPFVCIIINIRLRLLGDHISKDLSHGSVNVMNVESIEKDKGEMEIENLKLKKECWKDLEKPCRENIESLFLQYVIFYVLPLIYILFVIVYFMSALL